MSDHFGAETLPVTAPGLTATVSDLALDTLAAWLRAIIDAELTTAWATVAPGEPVLRVVQTQDPGGQDFSENLLPALFLFRTQADSMHFEDGNWGSESTITLLFVFPPAEQTAHARRLAIFSGLQKTIHRAIGPNNGRHPAWVVAGDVDPYAATYGSSILTHGGLVWVKPLPFQVADVMVDPMRAPYDAIKGEFRIRENYLPDETIDQNDLLVIVTANET